MQSEPDHDADVEAVLHTYPALLAARTGLRARLTAARHDPLREFLLHAARTVPRYSSVEPSADLAIEDFPPSDRASTVAAGFGAVSCAFPTEDLTTCTTSGSSGVPLVVVRDSVSRYDDYFEGYRRLTQFKPDVRELMRPGRCGVLAVNDNALKADGGAINPSLNNSVMLWRQASHVLADIARWCDTIEDDVPTVPVIAGRPSALLALSRVLGGRRLVAGAVFCSGENLYEDVRRTLENTFCAPVFDVYASREGGFMAVECPFRSGLHVLSARVRMEVLAGEGITSDTGCGPLVITNLENWAMPAIGYVTDDVGDLTRHTCRCGFTGTSIRRLFGRDAVYFHDCGRDVNPSLLDSVFEGHCLEYHVAQVAPSRFRVEYRADRDLNRHIERGISKLFQGATVVVTRVVGHGYHEHKRPRYSTTFTNGQWPDA